MNKLALPSSPKLQFRAFFVTMMLIALGLFGTQTASAAVLDTLHYNGHTYYLISENTYEGAASQALSLGGYLVTINDHGEPVPPSWRLERRAEFGCGLDDRPGYRRVQRSGKQRGQHARGVHAGAAGLGVGRTGPAPSPPRTRRPEWGRSG